jgi:hypothetical protein
MKELVFEEAGISTAGHLDLWKKAAMGDSVDFNTLLASWCVLPNHPHSLFQFLLRSTRRCCELTRTTTCRHRETVRMLRILNAMLVSRACTPHALLTHTQPCVIASTARNSGDDYPLSAFPEELLAAFPDAKFILTTRPAVKWFKSINATICRFSTSRYDHKVQPGPSMLV